MDSNYEDELENHIPVKNFCSVCGKLLQSTDALYQHLQYHHSRDAACSESYSNQTANPIIVQTSQQQIADHTIHTIFEKSINNVGPNSQKRTPAHEHLAAEEHQIRPNELLVRNPLFNHNIPNDVGNSQLQNMMASVHLSYLNTAQRIRNDQNPHPVQSNVPVQASHYHPTIGYQQKTPPMRHTNIQASQNAVQYLPAKISPVLPNYTAFDTAHSSEAARINNFHPINGHQQNTPSTRRAYIADPRESFQSSSAIKSAMPNLNTSVTAPEYQQNSPPLRRPNTQAPNHAFRFSPAKISPVTPNCTTYGKAHSNEATSGPFIPNCGYQQKSPSTCRTNMPDLHDAIHYSPATISPGGQNFNTRDKPQNNVEGNPYHFYSNNTHQQKSPSTHRTHIIMPPPYTADKHSPARISPATQNSTAFETEQISRHCHPNNAYQYQQKAPPTLRANTSIQLSHSDQRSPRISPANQNSNTFEIAQGNAMANSSNFHPIHGYQQKTPPTRRTNIHHDAVQYSPATISPVLPNRTNFGTIHMNIAATLGQLHPNDEYQQETQPSHVTNTHDTATLATINPVSPNKILFENQTELYKRLNYDIRVPQNFTSNSSRSNNNPNIKYNSMSEPGVVVVRSEKREKNTTKNNTILAAPITTWRCTLCGQTFNKRTETAKHKEKYHKNVKKNERIFTVISRSWCEEDRDIIVNSSNINSTHQNNPEPPQALPNTVIVIEDDEPEWQNYSRVNALHASPQYQAYTNLQQSQQYNSQTETAKVKNKPMLNIRDPAAVNNLVNIQNTDNTFLFSGSKNVSTTKNFETTLKTYTCTNNSEPIDTKNKRSHRSEDATDSDEDNGRQNKKIKSYDTSVKGRNTNETVSLVTNDSLTENSRLRSAISSSTESNTSVHNDNQNIDGTTKANNKAKYSESKEDFSKNKCFTENRNEELKKDGKNLSKPKECSGSTREHDSSDAEGVENNNIIRTPEHTQNQSDSVPKERRSTQVNSSDILLNYETVQKIIESYVNKTIATKDKSKKERKQKLYKCKICPKHFLTVRQFRKHLEKKHDRSKSGKVCNKCNLEFSKICFKEHVEEHHERKHLTAKDFDIVQNLSSTSSDSSDSDSSRTTSPSPNPNSKSHTLTPSASNRKPVEQANDKLQSSKERIPLENDKNTDNVDIEQTADSVDGSSFLVFQCDQCKKCFLSMITFNKHQNSPCGKQIDTKKCDLCPLIFSERSLKKHLTIHHSGSEFKTIKIVISNKTHFLTIKTLELDKLKKQENAKKVDKLKLSLKPVPKIMKTKFSKFTMTKELLETVFKSYSDILYKCRVCATRFSTPYTMQTHVNQSNHAMTTVTPCPICGLPFTRVSLERHYHYHHRYRKLMHESDFITKVRPMLKKSKHKKNVLDSKNEPSTNVNNKNVAKSKVETKNKKIRQGYYRDDTYIPLRKKTEEKGRNTRKYRHELMQQQKQSKHGQKIKTAIKKNISNTDRLNTHNKIVYTVYKCPQCDVYFPEHADYLKHLEKNHKLATEPYLCSFCNYRYCISRESFRLHNELHVKYPNFAKSFNISIVNDCHCNDCSTATINAIQTSCNNLTDNRNNIILKNCVVKLTNLQSALVSTTTTNENIEPETSQKQPVNSLWFSECNSSYITTSEDGKNTFSGEDSMSSEEFENKDDITDYKNENEQLEDDNSQPNSSQLERFSLVQTNAVNKNDDLFTTEDETFEQDFTKEPLLTNNIQGSLNDYIEHDHKENERNMVMMSCSNQKSIKIISNIVVKECTKRDYNLSEGCNETNTEELNLVHKKAILVSSTDKNLVTENNPETSSLLEDSNVIKSSDCNVRNLHETADIHSQKHHSFHESAVNIISVGNKIKETFTLELHTEDSNDSLSILSTNHTRADLKFDRPENEPSFGFGSDAIGNANKKKDWKDAGVSETEPKLNKNISKSTEDLIKLLEDDPKQKCDEVQQDHVESPPNTNTDIFVIKDKITVTEHNAAKNQSEMSNLIETLNLDVKLNIPTAITEKNEPHITCNVNKNEHDVDIAKNQSEISNLIKLSNADVQSNISITSRKINEANEACNINTNLINVAQNDKNEHDVNIATNQSEISNLTKLSNADIQSNISIASRERNEANEACNINTNLINVVQNDKNEHVVDIAKNQSEITNLTKLSNADVQSNISIARREINDANEACNINTNLINVAQNDKNDHDVDIAKNKSEISNLTKLSNADVQSNISIASREINDANEACNINTNLINVAQNDKNEHDVDIAKNQSEISNLTKLSNAEVQSNISIASKEINKANETCNINTNLINVAQNDADVVVIDDETDSPFIDDLYENETENDNNDISQRKPNRDKIKIKLPAIAAVTSSVSPSLLDDDLVELDDAVSSSTNTDYAGVNCNTVNVASPVANENDQFNRDVEYMIANIKKEPNDVDYTVSSSILDNIIIVVSDDEEL